MTKEHIGISLEMDIPMIFVFTKIDIAPEEVYKENFDKMKKILSKKCKKVPVKVTKFEDVENVLETISTGKVTPMFSVSSTTGEGIDVLRKLLSVLPKPKKEVEKAESEEEKVSMALENADS